MLLFPQPGFDVNAHILNGRNGLHYAADYGQKDVVLYLCSNGAKVDVRKRCLMSMYRLVK